MSKHSSCQQKHPFYKEDQAELFDELISEYWQTYQSPEWNQVGAFEVDRQKVKDSALLAEHRSSWIRG